jgi:hypothetical protein
VDTNASAFLDAWYSDDALCAAEVADCLALVPANVPAFARHSCAMRNFVGLFFYHQKASVAEWLRRCFKG